MSRILPTRPWGIPYDPPFSGKVEPTSGATGYRGRRPTFAEQSDPFQRYSLPTADEGLSYADEDEAQPAPSRTPRYGMSPKLHFEGGGMRAAYDGDSVTLVALAALLALGMYASRK